MFLEAWKVQTSIKKVTTIIPLASDNHCEDFEAFILWIFSMRLSHHVYNWSFAFF